VRRERHGARKAILSKNKDAHNASAPFYFTSFIEHMPLFLLQNGFEVCGILSHLSIAAREMLVVRLTVL